jgi:hypothetical protein
MIYSPQREVIKMGENEIKMVNFSGKTVVLGDF